MIDEFHENLKPAELAELSWPTSTSELARMRVSPPAMETQTGWHLSNISSYNQFSDENVTTRSSRSAVSRDRDRAAAADRGPRSSASCAERARAAEYDQALQRALFPNSERSRAASRRLRSRRQGSARRERRALALRDHANLRLKRRASDQLGCRRPQRSPGASTSRNVVHGQPPPGGARADRCRRRLLCARRNAARSRPRMSTSPRRQPEQAVQRRGTARGGDQALGAGSRRRAPGAAARARNALDVAAATQPAIGRREAVEGPWRAAQRARVGQRQATPARAAHQHCSRDPGPRSRGASRILFGLISRRIEGPARRPAQMQKQ
jgi:hypothetical protein